MLCSHTFPVTHITIQWRLHSRPDIVFFILASLNKAFVVAFFIINHAPAPLMRWENALFKNNCRRSQYNFLCHGCFHRRPKMERGVHAHICVCVIQAQLILVFDYKFGQPYMKVCQTITNSVAETNQSWWLFFIIFCPSICSNQYANVLIFG